MATHDVFVRKEVTLAEGESVDAFVNALSDAARNFIQQKLNGTKDLRAYVVDVFSKSVIANVYLRGSDLADEPSRSKTYAASYSRNNDGKFEFDSLTEVERVVGYKPKSSVSPTVKALGFEAEGWEVKKSLWAGVI